MSRNLESLAMIDIAEIILRENKEPLKIKELINKVREIKSVSEDDYERITQLYMDITQSGKFVFCGDDLWDLKERNLELWDKDGYAFVQLDDVEEVIEEDDEELEFTEFNLEDIEEDVEDEEDEEDDEDVDKDELEEEKEYIAVELDTKSTDDDDVDDSEIEFDDEDYDEDDYNEIMDDYEDMYDK